MVTLTGGGRRSGQGRYRQGVALARLSDLREYDRRAKRREHQEVVANVFSEGFMIALSLGLIPILVLPLLFTLPSYVNLSFDFLYWVILLFFILEYVLKLYYADDRLKFVISLRHIFDLFIIVASLTGSLVGLFPEVSGIPLLLRLLRLPLVAILGGRSLSRRGFGSEVPEEVGEERPMEWSVLKLSEAAEGWRPADLARSGLGKGSWLQLSHISDRDLPELERRFDLGGLAFSGRIRDWAYPRGEDINGRTIIFLQVPVEERDPNYPTSFLLNWQGLLIVDGKGGLLSLSRRHPVILEEIPQMAANLGLELRAATILHLIMVRSLDLVEDYIQAAEVELSRLETTPVSRQPRAYLSVTYGAKKEVDHTLAWLVHVRAIFKGLLDRKLQLTEWNEGDEARTRLLLEKCEFLLETAEDLSEGLADDIAFYLDTTAFQTNKVMKVIAVLTALTIIPTVVGGMLGMNIVGTPWRVSLAEIVTAVAVIMLFTSWIYFQIGWLKD
jgi:Mg2+ and Co2+ transporter CorA